MPRITKAMLEEKINTLHEQYELLMQENFKLQNKNNEIMQNKNVVSVGEYNSILEEVKLLRNLTKKFVNVANPEGEQQNNKHLNKLLKRENDNLKRDLKTYKKLHENDKIIIRDLKIALEVKEEKVQKLKNKPHNARGAGRKPKLTSLQVQELINKHKEGYSMGKLAKEFNISKGLVHKTIHSQINKRTKCNSHKPRPSDS